jgi:hypothetical protein
MAVGALSPTRKGKTDEDHTRAVAADAGAFAVGALKLIALLEAAKHADLTLQYSQVALAVGIIADANEWANNAKKPRPRPTCPRSSR